MPNKSMREEMKKQKQMHEDSMARKYSGGIHRDSDAIGSDMNVPRITFGSMPSYREDKLQEMKRHQKTETITRKDSSTSTELDRTVSMEDEQQFIELSPNNLAKLSHLISTPEKGILKHVQQGTQMNSPPGSETNYKMQWNELNHMGDGIKQREIRLGSDQSDLSSNQNQLDLNEVERQLKSFNGFHEEFLQAIHSSNCTVDLSHPANLEAAKKAYLESIPGYRG